MAHYVCWAAESRTREQVSAATPPEAIGEIPEDIAWITANTNRTSVLVDKTYSLRDNQEGVGWVFPPHVLQGFLEQGVEELYIAPSTRYVATQAYRDATEANARRARLRLDTEPYGELVEEMEGKLVPYTREGLPFPDISLSDPQAARKIIHNFLQADKGGGLAALNLYVYVLSG